MFVRGAEVASDTDGLHADVGVPLSRGLQHGDTLEAMVAGMARLGDRRTPASIIGAALDRALLGRVDGDGEPSSKEGS